MKTLLVPNKTLFTKKRYGRRADGGYIFLSELCDQTRIVYAYGVGDDTSCDNDLAKENKQIYLFDPTISEDSPCLNEMTEYGGYINGVKNRNFIFTKEPFSKDFASHIKQNDHEREDDMILKVDVEGAEWDGFLNCESLIFKCFSQMVIEFHHVTDGDETQKAVFKKILKYYYISHMHGNNWSPINNGIPETLEISFVRKDYVGEVKTDNNMYPINELDFPNSPYSADYQLNWWL